jgi:hypothetical protein
MRAKQLRREVAARPSISLEQNILVKFEHQGLASFPRILDLPTHARLEPFLSNVYRHEVVLVLGEGLLLDGNLSNQVMQHV